MMAESAEAAWGGLLAVLAAFGGLGLPLGIPPGPGDPLLAKVPPEECLFCTTWSGTAKPDPARSNQTEQPLAEPEIWYFLEQLDSQFKAGSVRAADDQSLAQVPEVAAAMLGSPGPFKLVYVDTRRVVETAVSAAGIWTKPDDLRFDPEHPAKGLAGSWPGGFLVLLGDGSVCFVPSSTSGEMLRRLFVRDGGKPLEPGRLE